MRAAPDDLYASSARLADALAAAGHDGWAEELVDVLRAGTTGSEVVMGLRWVLTRLAESGEVDATTATRVRGLAARAEQALGS